jgi:hypothetical protein
MSEYGIIPLLIRTSYWRSRGIRTSLYYNVSRPAEWVSEYNYFYGPDGAILPDFWGLGRDLTYAEILDKESDMWVLYLLKGDLDPIMFHQSNLRAFTYTGSNYPQIGLSKGLNHTLLGDLINATLTKYNKLFNCRLRARRCVAARNLLAG